MTSRGKAQRQCSTLQHPLVRPDRDLAQGIASPEDENDEPNMYEDFSLLDPGRRRRRRYLAPRTDAQAPSSV